MNKFLLILKFLIKHSTRILGVLIILLTTLYFSIQLPSVQTWLVKKATHLISNTLGTEVEVGNVKIDYLSHVQVNDILIRDLSKDTMIYVKNFDTKYSIFSFRNFKLNSEEIDLEGVKFYLVKEKDSILNLNKVFKKSQKANTPVDSTKGKELPTFLKNLTFNKLNVTDFSFKLTNIPRKQVISVKTDMLKADIHNFKISDKVFKVDLLELDKLDIGFDVSVREKNTAPEVPEFLDLPLNIDVAKLIVNKGVFHLLDKNFNTVSSYHHLALNDIFVSKINIDANQVEMRTGHLNAKINHFSCIEKSGLELKKIALDFKLSSYQMTAKNLIFKTNKSEFRGFLRFDYSNMIDYLHFCDKVYITSKFTNSTFQVHDLAFFVSSLLPYQNDYIKFSSEFKGLLNNLTLSNFNSVINDKAVLNGKIQIHSLFPIQDLTIESQLSQLIFNKSDLERFVPNLKLPEELSKFGTAQYVGNFKGSPYNFEINGALSTKLGHATFSQAKMDIRDMKSPKYSGNIVLKDFQLAELTTLNPSINHINSSFNIAGTGFNLKGLNTKLKGTISSIEINQSKFYDIGIDGRYQDNIFTGIIESNDPTLKFKTDGVFSMKESQPDMTMRFNFDNLDLKKLKITNKNLFLNSQATLNFKGKNIDDLLGELHLKNLKIKEVNDEFTKEYSFSDLKLESSTYNITGKMFKVNSEEIDGEIKGNFKPSELATVIKEYFLGYLQFEEERRQMASVSNVNFEAKLRLNKIKNYSTLFIKNLKNIDTGIVYADFDGQKNQFNIKATLNNITYNNIFIPNISLVNNSSISSFHTLLNVDSVFVNKKIAITPLFSQLENYDKGLRFNVELLKRTDDKFVDFNAYIHKVEDDYHFKILPFTSYFNRKIWQVDDENSIVYHPNDKLLTVKDVVLYKDDQKIIANSVLQDGYKNLVQLKFEDVHVSELISGLLPNISGIYGDLNGEIAINNVLEDPAPIANVSINKIIINKDTIGDLNLKSNFENGIVNSNLDVLGRNIDLNVSGMYNSNKDIDSFHFNVLLNKFNPKTLNPYLTDYLYDMNGNVRANLVVLGKLSRPQILGRVDIDTLSTVINTIHTRYHFVKQSVLFTPNQLVFKDLKFNDEFNNVATGNGFIKHKNLQNITLDLNVVSDKFYCLNTTSANNQSFYGKVFAQLNANFTGAIDNRITISASGKNLPESNITIAFNNSQNLEKYNFYEFVNKKEVQDTSLIVKKRRKLSGVNLDFNFDINNSGKLAIVMDPALEDRIDCTGEGKIAFKMSPELDMDIKGYYTINSGSYLFYYKNFIQRIFYLNQGGKISFTGNPYESIIDASATFKARANAQELVLAYFGETSDASILSAAKNKVKANVTLFMKNKLIQPDISYHIGIEQNNPTIQSAFQSIESITSSNPDELNRQVFYLLAFQRFFPPNVTGFEKVNNNTVGRDFSNTAIDVVAGKISGYFSEWVANSIKGLNFDFKYRNYAQTATASQTYSNVRNEFTLALSQKLFNDRLIFNAGGNYDFGQSDLNNNSNAFFGGDFDLEYLLSQSGEIRAKFYTTLDRDPLNAKYINKTGIGLVYRKEFDNMLDFLRIRRKKRFKSNE